MLHDAFIQEVCIEGHPRYAFENKLFSKINTNLSPNFCNFLQQTTNEKQKQTIKYIHGQHGKWTKSKAKVG
jgi:hypothetical protein